MIGVHADGDDGGGGENCGDNDDDDDDGYNDNCDVGDAHAQGASSMASSLCERGTGFIFARSKHWKFTRERHEHPQARDALHGHTKRWLT